MSQVFCAIPSCKRLKDKVTEFFGIPHDKRRNKWLEKLNFPLAKTQKDFLKVYRICRYHFVHSDFIENEKKIRLKYGKIHSFHCVKDFCLA